jgi:hypothetical protein
VASCVGGFTEQLGEQMAGFLHSQPPPTRLVVESGSVAFSGGDYGEDRVGAHDQYGEPVPGVPSADLMFVQLDVAFRGLGADLHNSGSRRREPGRPAVTSVIASRWPAPASQPARPSAAIVGRRPVEIVAAVGRPAQRRGEGEQNKEPKQSEKFHVFEFVGDPPGDSVDRDKLRLTTFGAMDNWRRRTGS